MSELSRWFPMAIIRTPQRVYDPFRPVDAWDDFADMDRQMRDVHSMMGRMTNDLQRLAPRAGYRGSPMDLRLAEDVLALDPIVTDEDGNKRMQMTFDVRSFKPEEIAIRTKDGKFLEVDARHEEEKDGHTIQRQYHRRFTVPQGVDVKEMTSSLGPDGLLCIAAPVREEKPAAVEQKERPMAITHE